METYSCGCGATIEIEVATDGYYVAECFDCGYYKDNASLFELKKRIRTDGCKLETDKLENV